MSRLLLLSWTFALAPAAQTAATLAGSVHDPAGLSVVNARVYARTQPDGPILETRTANDGSFRFSHLPAGKYTLEVTAKGLKPFRSVVRLNPGVEHQTVVRLELAALATAITVQDKADDLRAEVDAAYNLNKSVTAIAGQTATQFNAVANYDVLRLLPGVMSAAGGPKDRFSVPTNIRGAAAWGTVETVDEYPAINITPVSAEDGGYTASFSSIVPSMALRSIALATGGLGVTHGQAAGGVVKSTIKQGSPGRPFTSVRLEGAGVGEGVMMAETGGGAGKLDYYVAGQSVIGEYGDAYRTYARPIQNLRLYSGLVKAGYRVAPGSRLEGVFIGGNESHGYFQDSFVVAKNGTIRRDYVTDKENYFAAARYDYRSSDDLVFGVGLTHSRFHENRIEKAADGVLTGVSRRDRPQWATRGFTNVSLRKQLTSGLVYNGTAGGELTWDRFSDITTTPIGFSFREQSGYWRNSVMAGGRLSLIAGVRLSLINNAFRDLRRTSYDVGAAYLLPTQTRLKFSRSTGYKTNKAFYLWWGNGSFIQREPRRGLEPSDTGTWEGGAEQTLSLGAGRSGTLRATYFHTEEHGLFNFGDSARGVPFLDAARARGVELWTEWRLGRVRPFASFTNLSNVRTASTNPLANNVDLRFTALPNRAAGFGTQFDATRRILLVVMGYYDSGGIQEQVVNDSVVVSRYRGFAKVNAAANYSIGKRVTLIGRIENLLNRRDLGYSRTVLNPDGSTQNVAGTQRDPGTIVAAGLQYRF